MQHTTCPLLSASAESAGLKEALTDACTPINYHYGRQHKHQSEQREPCGRAVWENRVGEPCGRAVWDSLCDSCVVGGAV